MASTELGLYAEVTILSAPKTTKPSFYRDGFFMRMRVFFVGALVLSGGAAC